MMVLRIALAGLLLAGTALPSLAEIYKWTDSNGKVHYSDAAPAEQKAVALALKDVNTYTDVKISDAPEWQGFYQPAEKPRVKPVLMYSTAGCSYCRQARNYFVERHIAFTERKIDEDTAAWREYQRLDATGVPVILVGRKRMDGFSQARFDQLYFGDNPAH